MDFWISKWISGFQSDFSLDFWISVWISANGVRDFFRDGPLDFSSRMVNVLKLVVTLAVAGVLRCTLVYGQIQTCKFTYVTSKVTAPQDTVGLQQENEKCSLFGVVCTGLGVARLRGLCPHLSLDGGGRNNAIVEWRVTKASLPAYHSGIGLLLFLGDHVSQVFVECCRFKSHASLVEKTGDQPNRQRTILIMNRMCYRLVKSRFRSRAIFVPCFCKTISLKVL